MTRILAIVLVGVLVVSWGPARADDGVGVDPRDSEGPPVSENGGYGRWGLLLGAAGGMALGLAVAGMSDFPLKEGGGFGVMLLGGGLGAFVGHKIGSSAGKAWEDPGKLQVSVRQAWTMSAASKDIQAAFDATAFSATNEQHSLAPSVAVTYRMGRRFNTGVELSGISAQWFRYGDSAAHLTESVGGRSLGLIVNYAPMPSARRRLTWALGVGVDYYSVDVENYFDEDFDAGFPEEQPSRFSRSTDSTYGVQLRGSLDYYLVHDVSIQLGVSGRWASPIEVEGITPLTRWISRPCTSRSVWEWGSEWRPGGCRLPEQ
jgi:hypothetical protein